MKTSFDIVIIGLTITSSWGNGHATTYRGLVQGLSARGYKVLFLERDAEWYHSNQDEPNPAGATTKIYKTLDDLLTFEQHIAQAKLVIVGSYVPDGVTIGQFVISIARGATAFYDIDTPLTLSKIAAGSCEYLTPKLISQYNAYFSFTGGPTLRRIETDYGSPMARVLYCAVDTDNYKPVVTRTNWDLGYLGTYSLDRQVSLDKLLLSPARQWRTGRFTVAGPQYPADIEWPVNVERTTHLSPRQHPTFYGGQRFTLNITRDVMKDAGFSPSVRLFEAGSCGVPTISDWWPGLDTIFEPGKEMLIAETAEDVLRYLRNIDEVQRKEMADRARQRVRAEHSPLTRALQIEGYLKEMDDNTVSGSSRRHRRSRSISGRKSELSTEREWQDTSQASERTASAVSLESSVHQPAPTNS